MSGSSLLPIIVPGEKGEELNRQVRMPHEQLPPVWYSAGGSGLRVAVQNLLHGLPIGSRPAGAPGGVQVAEQEFSEALPSRP